MLVVRLGVNPYHIILTLSIRVCPYVVFVLLRVFPMVSGS